MPWKKDMFVPSIVYCPHCGARNKPTATTCDTCYRSPDEQPLQKEARPASSPPVAQKTTGAASPPPVQKAPDPYTTTHTLLGENRDTGMDVDIADVTRYSGMYILGKQGMGKSSLLEFLIWQDIARKDTSVIVIDPHGDLVDAVIAQIPERRLDKTYLLDMEDEAYPFGVNVFSGKKGTGSIAQTQAVDRVMHIFEVIWGDILGQRDLPRYLRLATLVLLANPGTTLVDMYYFLRDDDDRLREMMLRNVRDPDVKYFWQSFSNKSPSARKKEIEPLFNRLEGLFLGRTLVKNIVGQAETSIDFRRAIENKEIILIKLPRKILPQDAALIGTMLTAQIHAAIFSFADMPADRRPGFSLYVDEFEHFATNDFAEMFAEGRKFGVRLTLAHQTRSQIPRTLEVLRSTTFNAATVLCFAAPDDASEMARLFPGKATVRPEDIDPDPVEFLLNYGSDSPILARFTRHLSSMQGSLPFLRAKTDTRGRASRFEYELRKQEIGALSHFLYEVEKTGNWQAPIPRYFVDAERSYTLYAFSDLYTDAVLLPLLKLPFTDAAQIEKTRQLINSLPIDERGLKRSCQENPYANWRKDYADALAKVPGQREDFLQLLVDTRSAMRYLAVHPLGKLTVPSSSQVATQIISLKPRQALVKTTSSTYHIQTIDTRQIKTVPLPEQQKRKRAILEQTHKKYCKPATEVEQETQERLGVLSSEDAGREVTGSDVEAKIEFIEPAVKQQAEKQPAAQTPVSLDTMNSLFTQMRAKEIDPDTTILAALGEHYVMTIKQWMRLFAWGSYPRATQYFKELREEGQIYRKDREGRGGQLVEGDWFFLLTKGANELMKRKQPEPLFTLEPNEAERSSGDTLVHTYLVNDLLIHLRLLEREQPETVRIEQIVHERSMRRAYLAALQDSKLYPDGFLRLLVPTPNGLKRQYLFLELQHTTQRDEANWKAKCRKYLALFEQETLLEKFFASKTPSVLVITINPEYIPYHKRWTAEVLEEARERGRAYSSRFIIGSYDAGISNMSVTPVQYFCEPRFSTPFQNAARSLLGT